MDIIPLTFLFFMNVLSISAILSLRAIVYNQSMFTQVIFFATDRLRLLIKVSDSIMQRIPTDIWLFC